MVRNVSRSMHLVVIVDKVVYHIDSIVALNIISSIQRNLLAIESIIAEFFYKLCYSSRVIGRKK